MHSIFGNAIFNVPFITFCNKYYQVEEQIWGIAKKKRCSRKKWNYECIWPKDLVSAIARKKSLHLIVDYQECLKNYKSTLPEFPVKGPLLKLNAEKYGLMKDKVLRDVTSKQVKLFAA